MRLTVVALAFVFSTAPACALAQTVAPAPAASPAGTMATEMSAGLAMLPHIMQMQQRVRTATLAALTPAHRDLLAKIVGELAIAADPNFDVAAARLDAALSPAEVQALGRVEAAKRAEFVSEAGQMESALQSKLSPDQLKQMQADAVQAMRTTSSQMGPAVAKMVQAQSDPGHMLLQTVLLGVQPFSKMLGTMPQTSGSR